MGEHDPLGDARGTARRHHQCVAGLDGASAAERLLTVGVEAGRRRHGREQGGARRCGEALVDGEHGVPVVPHPANRGRELRPAGQVEGDEAGHGSRIRRRCHPDGGSPYDAPIDPVHESGRPDLRGRRAPLRASIAADFRDSGWGRRFALVALVAWIVYEWGPGNETVTPWLVLRVIDRADHGVQVVVAAGTVGFAFTFTQQLLSGLTALVAFSLFERTAAAAWERLSVGGTKTLRGWHGASIASKLAVAFTIGTSAVALVQIVTSGRVGVRIHLRAVVGSAAAVGAVAGGIATVAGALVWLGRSVSSLSGVTDSIVDVLGNPLLWLGLAAVALAIDWRRHRRALAAGAHSAGPTPG